MLIRDLEMKSGLDRATIRFYEKEDLIVPERRENGYRNYTAENLDQLLKIKLLRQLGMSLDKIKQLQQGRIDLQTVLAEQIQILEQRIKETQQAKMVCLQMQNDRAGYADLDVQHYLNVLSTPRTSQQSTEFRERICREYHPFRRLLARWTDFLIIRNLLEFLLVVVLKVRPYPNIIGSLLTYATAFLMVPITAGMLHHWGFTPGKWCLGLQVESENGDKLTCAEALQREWEILRDGYGFGIPFWSIWRLYKSYRTYQERELDWDWNVEYSYHRNTTKQKFATAGVVLAIVLLIAGNVDAQFQPKYHGDLTVAEFANNYNHYQSLLYSDRNALRQLQPDGSYYAEPATATLYLDGTPAKKNYAFDYVTEGEKLVEICYQNQWNDVFYLDPISVHCDIAAIAAVMAQKGMTRKDLKEFAFMWDQESLKQAGDIQFGDVRIIWKVESKNCKQIDGFYYSDDEDASDTTVSLDLVIRLPEQENSHLKKGGYFVL